MATTKKVVRVKYEKDGEEELSGTMAPAQATRLVCAYSESNIYKNVQIVDNGEFEG